jgi:hypothetical protein
MAISQDTPRHCDIPDINGHCDGWTDHPADPLYGVETFYIGSERIIDENLAATSVQ